MKRFFSVIASAALLLVTPVALRAGSIQDYSAAIPALQRRASDEKAAVGQRSALEDYLRLSASLAAAVQERQATNNGAIFQLPHGIGALMTQRADMRIRVLDGAGDGVRKIVEDEMDEARKSGFKAELETIRNLSEKADLKDLETKYFSGDKKGNLLEGKINDLVFHETWDKALSPFEITFRLEPVAVFADGDTFAGLATAGVVYHRLPAFRISNDGQHIGLKSDAHWPERVGLRLGVGAYASGEHDALAGAGLQLEAWTLWGLYSWRGDTFVVALGISEFKSIKKLLPFF